MMIINRRLLLGLVATALMLAPANFLGAQTPAPKTATFPILSPFPYSGNAPAPNGTKRKLTLEEGKFKIDGQPVLLMAGEIHLIRVPHATWETRILQAKAMGLNSMSVYLMWNSIEAEEGQFDFTGQNDVRRFAELCQKHGMWLLVRPGPYVCAEVDWGGIPYWLGTKDITKLRGVDLTKEAYDRRYIKKVGEQIAGMEAHEGGPILMVQIENEHRSIDDYMIQLERIFRESGFDGQLFTCDPGMKSFDKEVGIPGVLRGVNGLTNDDKLLARARELSAKVTGHPVFCAESYTSWFARWGKKIPRRDSSSELNRLRWLLKNDVSFCYYMFHGGSNFTYNTMPTVVTSYDYDAPIDEAGRTTPKYYALREAISQQFGLTLPDPPPEPKVITIPPFTVERQASLMDLLTGVPITTPDAPKTFEPLGVGGGFVLYRKKFPEGLRGTLNLSHAKDMALVMINGERVAFVHQFLEKTDMQVSIPETKGPAVLDILVHNLGRDRAVMEEKKGLTSAPLLDGKPLKGWEMYPLPLLEMPTSQKGKTTGSAPALYRGTFKLAETGETFLDMSKFRFGVAWVNGHILGRHWDAGSPRSLFLPSSWQKKGINEIVVLDILPSADNKIPISGTERLIEIKPQAFKRDIKVTADAIVDETVTPNTTPVNQ